MIPPGYETDQPCYGKSYADPKERARHDGHTSRRDCFFLTWDEAPLPWVKRVNNPPGSKLRYGRMRGWHDGDGNRVWHLAIGIRKETGSVQVDCNIGSGPGPFKWRDKPVLNWAEEPNQWFCRKCVAEWTRRVRSVTVRAESIRVTKGQLTKLLEAIEGPDLKEIELRPTSIEDKPALIAEITEGDRDKTKVRFLIAGNGVVRL